MSRVRLLDESEVFDNDSHSCLIQMIMILILSCLVSKFTH